MSSINYNRDPRDRGVQLLDPHRTTRKSVPVSVNAVIISSPVVPKGEIQEMRFAVLGSKEKRGGIL